MPKSKSNKIQILSEILSIEEYEKRKLKLNKRIIVICSITKEKIQLLDQINILTDSLLSLYLKIQDGIKKVNIESIIINKYLYTPCSINELVDIDTFLNRKPLIDDHGSQIKVSTLLNKDYNKNYIEVSLILGSYVPYIEKIILEYTCNIYEYDEFNYNLFNQELYDNEDRIEFHPDAINIAANSIPFNYCPGQFDKKNEIEFLHNLYKINDKCLSLDNYNKIKLRIANNTKVYIICDSRRLKEQEFLLNEIDKYFTIF